MKNCEKRYCDGFEGHDFQGGGQGYSPVFTQTLLTYLGFIGCFYYHVTYYL